MYRRCRRVMSLMPPSFRGASDSPAIAARQAGVHVRGAPEPHVLCRRLSAGRPTPMYAADCPRGALLSCYSRPLSGGPCLYTGLGLRNSPCELRATMLLPSHCRKTPRAHGDVPGLALDVERPWNMQHLHMRLFNFYAIAQGAFPKKPCASMRAPHWERTV